MEGGKGLKKDGKEERKTFFCRNRLLFFTLSVIAEGTRWCWIKVWDFLRHMPCIRAFHMTSIVISLYFKQENCETLISLDN